LVQFSLGETLAPEAYAMNTLQSGGAAAMPDFKKRRRESVSAWFARLSTVDMAALNPGELDDLTLRRVLATQAVRRELRRRGGRNRSNGDAEDSADLRQCKEQFRALSSDDRRRLMQWAEKDLPD
jgi:hypothetical protein